MKIINIILRVIFALLLVSPILGILGIFPAPTADLYSNATAFNFISSLYASGYIMPIMALVFAVSIILIIMNRLALASLLILPFTVNIVAFHLFLNGGIFIAGAIMGDLLAILNIYFLWRNRAQYRQLWNKSENIH